MAEHVVCRIEPCEWPQEKCDDRMTFRCTFCRGDGSRLVELPPDDDSRSDRS